MKTSNYFSGNPIIHIVSRARFIHNNNTLLLKWFMEV